MCLNPRLIANPKYKPNKKNGGVIPAIRDIRVLAVPIGCGECIECKRKKAREWQVRLQEDIRHHKNGHFITLTFSNEEITKLYNEINTKVNKDTGEIRTIWGYEKDNEIATVALRRCLERIRKETKKSVRHWFITELGHEGTENIHMHGIIWTDNIKLIHKHWKYGYIWQGDYLNNSTVNYMIKYVHKMDFKHKYFKPKMLNSAGIGGKYIERYDFQLAIYQANGETREYYLTREGIKLGMPIYYRNKRYNDEEREILWIEKLDQQKRYVLGHEIDISENMDKYYNMLKEARQKNEKLGYGNGHQKR